MQIVSQQQREVFTSAVAILAYLLYVYNYNYLPEYNYLYK